MKSCLSLSFICLHFLHPRRSTVLLRPINNYSHKTPRWEYSIETIEVFFFRFLILALIKNRAKLLTMAIEETNYNCRMIRSIVSGEDEAGVLSVPLPLEWGVSDLMRQQWLDTTLYAFAEAPRQAISQRLVIPLAWQRDGFHLSSTLRDHIPS